MAQVLRALAAPVENLDSAPNTHTAAYNLLYPGPEINTLF